MTTGGLFLVNFTGINNNELPAIVGGSRFELNGSFFRTELDEDPVGWSATANGWVFVYARPIGQRTAEFIYSNVQPTYQIEKGGWYHPSQNWRSILYGWRQNAQIFRDKKLQHQDNIISPADHHIPVGSIRLTIRSDNPQTYYLNTTWVAWGMGRVPVGVASSGTFALPIERTGGSETHILTIEEMPSHNHDIIAQAPGGGNTDTMEHNNTNPRNRSDIILNTGGGQSHNNLQPWINCYMWKRTA
jgi:hypothetical protein